MGRIGSSSNHPRVLVHLFSRTAGQISFDSSSGAGCFGEKRPDLSFGTKRR